MKNFSFGVAFGAWVFIIQQLWSVDIYVWCGLVVAASLVLYWRYRK